MSLSPLELINDVLRDAKTVGASDIHLKTDKLPVVRLDGELHPLGEKQIISADALLDFVAKTCPPAFLPRWQTDNQVDYSYSPAEIARFRVSAFYQRGTPSIVFRYVKEQIPTFESLHLDADILKQLCTLGEGIVLLCGPTGSGKSSTLAAMLNHINNSQPCHVITLEDPIEYAYTDKNCVFNQREVGIDTPSFADGLKVALRQDPDIILVGEMRDRDTFETALTAAETGHLVFGTLHSSNAQQAIQRLFEFFDPHEQASRRRQIACTLQATLTQKLLPASHGGRVPAIEIFLMDVLGRRVIEAGEFEKIPAVLEAGKDIGSRSFNADLYRLIQDGVITRQVGLEASPNPKALEMNIKGIFLSQGGIVS